MEAAWFSVVITIWLGVHPFTYTLPKAYNYDQIPECIAMTEKLKDHWHPAQHSPQRQKTIKFTIECVVTPVHGEI